jgi:hypothetical protein
MNLGYMPTELLPFVVLQLVVLLGCALVLALLVASSKAIFAFCRPLLLRLTYFLTGILSLVSLEFVVLQGCAHVLVLLIVGPSSSPTSDPYIPRAKRPPLKSEQFLTWINDFIERTIDRFVPMISSNRARRSKRQPTRASHSGPRFKYTHGYLCYLFEKSRNSWWPGARRKYSNHQSYCWKWRKRRRASRTTLLALTAVTIGVARAQSAMSSQKSSRAIFDSDSFDILVDGGATASISNCLGDFVTPPKESTVRVKGFNGTTSATKVGTVIWHVLDDSGHRRKLTIRNTYYVPECPVRLLSPQHYSQQTKDLRGTYATNYGDQALFVWNRGLFRVTMPLSPGINVGMMRSAPGHKVFANFVAESPAPTHFCCPVVSDDEADAMESEDDDSDTLSSHCQP